MKRIYIVIISAIILLGSLGIIYAHLDHRLYDLQKNKEMFLADAIADLKKNRIILVGEHHTNPNHHTITSAN
jgi:uncharacterized iron-regulated protein